MSEKKDVIRSKWRWPETRDWGVPFTKNWLNFLVSAIDGMQDREQARSILSKPAESCAASFLDHLSKDHGLPQDSADLSTLIRAMNEHILDSRFGPGCEWKDNAISVVYPPLGGGETDCGCPLVFNEVVKLTPTQCFCSARMHQLVFEHVIRRPVRVDILESLGQGGQKCAFKLQIQE